MKPTLSRFPVLVLFITFLTITSASPTGAQPPEPPEIMENGEIPKDLYVNDQAITERRLATVDGGNNSITATTSYWSSSGTTFVPSNSAITYSYGTGGCVDVGNDGVVLLGDVNLPHGSTIVGMWFNYYNEVVDPIDSTIYLRRFSFYGTYDTILSVGGTSTGVGHQSSDTFTVTNPVVDNFNYVYVLAWIGKLEQRLCGVNLVYTPPTIFFNALPMINR